MLSDAFKRIGTCFNASVNDINTADRRSVKRRSCFRKSKTCIIYVQNAATQAQRSIFRCLALCLINRGEHGRDKFTGCGFQSCRKRESQRPHVLFEKRTKQMHIISLRAINAASWIWLFVLRQSNKLRSTTPKSRTLRAPVRSISFHFLN
jgi:hypothetical protein